MSNPLFSMKFILIYFLFLFFVPVHLAACSDSSKDADDTVSLVGQTHLSDIPLELPKKIISNTYFFDLYSTVSSTLYYSSFILIGCLALGGVYYTYQYWYAIINFLHLITPGYIASPDDEFFLGLSKYLDEVGMPKVNQKDLSFYDTTPLNLNSLVPSSYKVPNICTDTSVSLKEFCTTNAASSNSENITTITAVLDTIIDVASK